MRVEPGPVARSKVAQAAPSERRGLTLGVPSGQRPLNGGETLQVPSSRNSAGAVVERRMPARPHTPAVDRWARKDQHGSV